MTNTSLTRGIGYYFRIYATSSAEWLNQWSISMYFCCSRDAIYSVSQWFKDVRKTWYFAVGGLQVPSGDRRCDSPELKVVHLIGVFIAYVLFLNDQLLARRNVVLIVPYIVNWISFVSLITVVLSWLLLFEYEMSWKDSTDVMKRFYWFLRFQIVGNDWLYFIRRWNLQKMFHFA